MKRYLSLYFHFFRNCWMKEMEFRTNMFIWSLIDFSWFFLTIFFINLIFGQVTAIAGWTKNEVLLVVLVQQLFIDILWSFVIFNMNNFSSLIRQGKLDYVLLKPLNSRFLVSTRYVLFDHYLRMIAIIILIVRTMSVMSLNINLLNFFGAIILFILGLLIFYSLFYLITTTNFWFINIFNLEALFDEITDVGKMPVYIFKGGMRLIFTYIVPVAFIATFPVQFLLGKGNPLLIVYGLIISVIFFIISEWFWRYALKHYSSASS